MIVASRREKAAYYLYLIPAFAVFAIFIFWPTVQSFYLSLCKYSMSSFNQAKYVGFFYYKFLFTQDPHFWEIMKNTAVYTFITVPVLLGCGLLLAMAVHSKLLKRTNFYKVAYYIPYVSSMVAVSLVFKLLFAAGGSVDQLLSDWGLSKAGLLSDGTTAMAIVILLSVWKSVGYVMIIYLGGLCAISDDIYEAVSLDRIGPMKKLFKITLPLLKPTIIMLFILNLGQIFRSDFGLFYQVPMNQGALFDVTQTIDTYVYRALLKFNDVGMSSAASFIQSVVGFVFIVTANKIISKLDKSSALF